MNLGWNEIKDRAIQFSKEWKNETYEAGEAKSFLDAFFNVFGISRRRVATFEHRIKKFDGNDGFIDLLWKGVILIEMKSKGKDLIRAYSQATQYFDGLKDSDLPQYIMVCDFERIKLYDLENDREWEFPTKELYKKIKLFGFLAGYKQVEFNDNDPVNIKAAEKMGKLHDSLKENGYEGHNLELYLVRLLFCLFADDTAIFNKNIFYDYISDSKIDGSDLSLKITKLFEVLNTPEDKRMKTISEELNSFPYINGGLFAENVTMPDFNSKMRNILIDVCALDWGNISPAIFGAMFQSVMNPIERREMGAHYTSEQNIQKVIRPLFLDDLWSEFDSIKNNIKKLEQFHSKLAGLKFLDPACGCGNFLIITYRELRELELEVVKRIANAHPVIDVSIYIKVNVNQFYGIEYEEFPSLIAKTAMWLIDHQMNMKFSEEFGLYFARLPLTSEANIKNANALRIKWEEFISPNELNYILGNPPFIGKKFQDDEQKQDMIYVFGEKYKGVGNLDYVACWYKKACEYIENTNIEVAFVSTNSICQGEQVQILWEPLFDRNSIKINFAYKTFIWGNEAKGKAAVHCIIVGLSSKLINRNKIIYDGNQIYSVENINPYLVGGKVAFIKSRRDPISAEINLVYGSFALDDGHYTISEEEKIMLVNQDDCCLKFIRPFIGSYELINAKNRYCIWLKGANPKDIQNCKIILDKINKVKNWRMNSKRKETIISSENPSLFAEIRQPDSDYMAIPIICSEKRKYLPITFLGKEVIASNQLLIIANASLYHFGILISNMHMAWMKTVAGRLKSDYRYSASIVYNNFPWPNPTESQKKVIEITAQEILDVRSRYLDSSLADLYDPLTMPLELVRAHDKLDKAVEKAYTKSFNNDADRVSHLFELYSEIVNKN